MVNASDRFQSIRQLIGLLLNLSADARLFLVLCLRPAPALAAENLFLRKQLSLYEERQAQPGQATNAIRLAMVWLSYWFDWQATLRIVKPATFTGWHRQGFRLFWRWKSKLDRDLFCDPDTGLAGCNDGAFLDDGDAAMIGLHGADSGNHWQGALRRNGGSSVNDCRIDAADGDGSAEELFAGDLDLEFLHFSSCNSMDDDNLPFAWRFFEDPVDSPNNGRRLHQATGFHGFMWIGGCCDDQYEDFAADAHSVSIKDAWMDNMFVTGINGSATQCPVAYAVGTNRNDCFNRIDNERYNNVFSDPSSIGYYCYYYYAGCDPSGETAFVDPN